MADGKYVSPSIRTTIPPRDALDLDKPCSFAPMGNKLLGGIMQQIGARPMERSVVQAVLATDPKQGPEVVAFDMEELDAYMPPDDPDARWVYDQLTRDMEMLDPNVVREEWSRRAEGGAS